MLISAAERFGVALLAATLLALGAPSLPAVAATAAPSAAEGPAAAEQAAQPSGVERRIPSTMATDAQVLQLERERSKMPEIQVRFVRLRLWHIEIESGGGRAPSNGFGSSRSCVPCIAPQAPTGSDLERMMASPGMRTGKDPRAHS